jgi:hypothetical protein
VVRIDLLPPGGVGRVRVFALEDADEIRDDPAVLTFRGIRIEFR